MLGDAEQRRLVEIETLLRYADPRFVRRIEGGWRKRHRRRILAMIALPIGMLMTFIGLAAGSVVAAVIGLSVTCAAAGVWFCHRSVARRPAERDDRS